MNKFQKLYQINKDIELLENAGKIKAANVLHKKFIKEAQYMMPMMPQMMMPQMMMPQMLARPTVAPTTLARPVVTPAPMPVAQPRTTPVQTIGPPNPGVSPAPSPAPAPKPSPGNMQIAPLPSPAPAPGGQVQPPYEGSNSNPGGQNVPPPTPPPTQYGDKNKKDQELQYLENELQRLQREYGMDCGPFAAQCNTLRGMIDKNKGGSVAKS